MRRRRRCQRVFVGTMLSGSRTRNYVKSCASSMPAQERAQVRKQVDGQTTHIITSDDHTTLRCSRTMKYFLGVARGLWVVSARWLDACSKAGKWVSEEAFEIIGGIPIPPRPDRDWRPRRSRLTIRERLAARWQAVEECDSASWETLSLSRCGSGIKTAGAGLRDISSRDSDPQYRGHRYYDLPQQDPARCRGAAYSGHWTLVVSHAAAAVRHSARGD